MVRVLFDYQAFEMQKLGGISRYFFELSRNFLEKEVVWKMPIRYSSNKFIHQMLFYDKSILPVVDEYENFFFNLNFKGKWTIYSLRNRLLPFLDKNKINKRLSLKEIRGKNFDIIHPTYYDNYFLDSLDKKPLVVTVFDMIHEKYPEYFFGHKTIIQKKNLVRKATKIIAISENTKQDLIRFLNVPQEKIEVVYLANSLPQDDNHIDFEDTPSRYLLYVGTRSIYKNFIFFVKSVSPLLLNDPDLKIVCAGQPFTNREILLFADLKIQNQIYCYETNDFGLSYLYKNALAFVFPSIYEGFGLPVLEAFACGCPAILSRASSLPEIGGDAAAYFDPQSQSELQSVVKLVVYDSAIRKNLSDKGYARNKYFSWRQTAELTKKVYESTL